MALEIKICTRAEYPAFLDAANDAFSYGAANEWFQKNLGNCTPRPDIATDEEIGRHFLCYCDGQLAGALGAYPLDWVVAGQAGGQATLAAYGIGQVCCLPAYRGRGVMSALLKASEDAMRAQGRVLGFLGGDRFRYGRVGYDFGGNTVRYTFDRHRFTSGSDALKVKTRPAKPDDWSELARAYDTLPSRIVRDARGWERQLRRENTQWHIGEADGRKAYLACQSPDSVLEIYGAPDVAAAILRGLFGWHKLDRLTVSYPLQNGVPDAMCRMLYGAASHAQVSMLGLSAIIDAPGVLSALEPLCGEAIKKCVSVETQALLARRLLGYAHQPLPDAPPELSAALLATAPLCAWISGADDV